MPERFDVFVVVHGIGRQEPNTTLREILRAIEPAYLANLPTGDNDPSFLNAKAWSVTSGAIYDRLGTRKERFEGRSDESVESKAPYFEVETANHTRLRFAEVWWQDILENGFAEFGEDTGSWVEAAARRAWTSHTKANRSDSDSDLGLLSRIVKILRFADSNIPALLFRRYASTIGSFREVAFGEYLSDVQAYAESARVRSEARSRFVSTLDRISTSVALDYPDVDLRFTVIGHSLGSVLAFDSLLTYWAEPGDARNRVLGKVGTLITLGSPIDKVLGIWKGNYKPFEQSVAKPLRKRIPHLNYSDEQDPIGGYLDSAASQVWYDKVFEKKEDVVSVRYPLPGKAHLDYLKDTELFQRLLWKAAVQPDIEHVPILRDRPGIAVNNALLAFLVVPAIGVGLEGALLHRIYLSVSSESIGALEVILGSLVLAGVSWFGREIVGLVIWWRRLALSQGERKTQVDSVEVSPDQAYFGRGGRKGSQRYRSGGLWGVRIVDGLFDRVLSGCTVLGLVANVLIGWWVYWRFLERESWVWNGEIDGLTAALVIPFVAFGLITVFFRGFSSRVEPIPLAPEKKVSVFWPAALTSLPLVFFALGHWLHVGVFYDLARTCGDMSIAVFRWLGVEHSLHVLLASLGVSLHALICVTSSVFSVYGWLVLWTWWRRREV